MVAAAVAYLLRSVDVGAQAPTPFSVKMPSGHLVQRAAKIQKIRATFVVVVVFSQENTRLSTNCDSSAAEKKLSPTPLHYPLIKPAMLECQDEEELNDDVISMNTNAAACHTVSHCC